MSTVTETNLNELIETTVKEVLDQRLQTLVEEKLQRLRKKESRPKRVAIAMVSRGTLDAAYPAFILATACLTQRVIDEPTPMRSAFGSDHYGLLNTYSYRRTAC